MKRLKINKITDLKPGDIVRSTKTGNLYNVRAIDEDCAILHHIIHATNTEEWEKLEP